MLPFVAIKLVPDLGLRVIKRVAWARIAGFPDSDATEGTRAGFSEHRAEGGNEEPDPRAILAGTLGLAEVAARRVRHLAIVTPH